MKYIDLTVEQLIEIAHDNAYCVNGHSHRDDFPKDKGELIEQMLSDGVFDNENDIVHDGHLQIAGIN